MRGWGKGVGGEGGGGAVGWAHVCLCWMLTHAMQCYWSKALPMTSCSSCHTHTAAQFSQWCRQALVGLRALESLDACGNQLKRGGACALAKACARKPGLVLLALDENEISEAGLEALRVSGGWAGRTGLAVELQLPRRPPSCAPPSSRVIYPRQKHAALICSLAPCLTPAGPAAPAVPAAGNH